MLERASCFVAGHPPAWCRLLCVTIVGWAISAGPNAAEAVEAVGAVEAEPVFERDVRPILKAHCFHCHGEEPELKGGLDLRLVRLMVTGGDSGSAVEPGDADRSLLWQRVASDEMPAGSKKLTDSEKDLLRRWLAAGARTSRPEPERVEDARYTPEELEYWAFQPVRAVAPPQNSGSERASAERATPIDAFVAQRLADRGLDFSPPADRRTLIRRVSLDLIGLPPTEAEIAVFVADRRPDAWERLVDRLLSSPQYGVRWGRNWLDVAGYAESDGNVGTDRSRPHAWHYRDYVIRAFNDDKPYDQFLIEQLAGDELLAGSPDPSNARHLELLSATGFLRMAPDITATDNSVMDRNQAVSDMVKVVSSSVLGLTVGCAQCHDHRYDPISIEDYYRLRAVFDPAFPLEPWKQPDQRLIDLTDEPTRLAAEQIEKQAVEIEQDIRRRRREHCQAIQDRQIENSPAEVRDVLRAAVNTPADKQTAEQKALLDRYPTVRTVDWIVGQLIEYDMPAHRRFEAEEKKVAELRETKPPSRLVMAAVEEPQVQVKSAVLFRGDPQQPKEAVEPAELYVLSRQRHSASLDCQPTPRGTSGRRLAYAQQLTDGSHPLVARVIVNRIWLHHFGRGLVGTPSDFGAFGERPTHPELLDWLADDFVRHGWSIKRLQRMIVSSRVYQQSSRRTPQLEQADPENRLLGRMNLRRGEAEQLRDGLLAVSGLLNFQLAGPSVPVDEDGEGKAVIGKRTLRDGLFAGIQASSGDEYRRSVYISSRRTLPLNVLETFDLPAMTPNCPQRPVSTSPTQALWFLNDEVSLKAAGQLARRLIQSGGDSAEAKVRSLFVTLFAAEPSEAEQRECVNFVKQQVELLRAQPDPAWQETIAKDSQAVDVQAWGNLCQMLMASNRFLYTD